MFRKLSLAAAVTAAVCPSLSAAEKPLAPAEQNIERIDVTGSRLKGVDLEGAQPLTVLDQDDIARSGADSIHDLLKDISQLRGGLARFPHLKVAVPLTPLLLGNQQRACAGWARPQH